MEKRLNEKQIKQKQKQFPTIFFILNSSLVIFFIFHINREKKEEKLI